LKWRTLRIARSPNGLAVQNQDRSAMPRSANAKSYAANPSRSAKALHSASRPGRNRNTVKKQNVGVQPAHNAGNRINLIVRPAQIAQQQAGAFAP